MSNRVRTLDSSRENYISKLAPNLFAKYSRMSHYVHASLCVSILDLEPKADMVPISTEPTLADVIARHEEDASLTPNRRRDLKSAVLRMSEITGVDPRVTPASLRFMRPRINAVRPAKYHLTPKTWSNLRANFRAAVVQPAPRQPRRPDIEWRGFAPRCLPDG
jgi:hypothetical protein